MFLKLEFTDVFSREYTSSVVTESGGPDARCSKASKEASWWKGKFALFWMLATGAVREGGRAVQRLTSFDSCPKADFPRLTISGQKPLSAEGGATCRNSTVGSDSHL